MSSLNDEVIETSSRAPTGHATTDPAGQKSALVSKSPADLFRAFSLYFDLPLKVAAEKFGIRATAFKKRCRSVGIRHWPYRKVRSLKRLLQELRRCKEQAALSDKQEAQSITYKRQLEKLLDPETYGLNATGCLKSAHQQQQVLRPSDKEDDNVELEQHGPSLASPRRCNPLISDCNVSPTDRDGKRVDEIFPAGSTHLRTRRNHVVQLPSPHWSLIENRLKEEADETTYWTHYDDLICPNPVHTAAADPIYGFDSAELAFLPSEPNVRFLPGVDEEFFAPASQVDITNERFLDDVFLHISPDYGALV